ncbi:protein MEMO1-like [Corticium candelabrum]|uniref:protein MEMO1-like n=1 Tax=Corticium candelabrum TaxID=121492 RepID=UPI002E25A340|nr:protein MEMO1-like [Corticium candelabrum]
MRAVDYSMHCTVYDVDVTVTSPGIGFNYLRMSCRRASHAGSWYADSGRTLTRELQLWLEKAELKFDPTRTRALIAPHAGYRYSGPCAAHAYKHIDPTEVKRIFILGPSHHIHLPGCALSKATTCETPLYPLTVDQGVVSELRASGMFEELSLKADENEHSIEMHLPFIAKAMESKKGAFAIIPIVVGALKPEGEQKYGRLLSKYILDSTNLFIISSDFCHWGKRFQYTFYDKSHGAIHQSIEALDRKGMDIVESLNPTAFTEYLQEFSNTICGRHPMSVLLHAVSCAQGNNSLSVQLRFVKYCQSNQCKDMNDSSVSYASAVLTLKA